jgi:outer membrane protein OmpA-like peptidoglycan-associated protein
VPKYHNHFRDLRASPLAPKPLPRYRKKGWEGQRAAVWARLWLAVGRAFAVMSKIFVRPVVVATLALALAVGTAGCQTLSDLDPTGLIGGDDNTPAPDTQFPPDSQQQATQDANTTTPDLAALPARPAQPDAAAQANATQQVNAAGAQAQYSADALRAGTDASAPAPAATDANAAKQALASSNDVPPTAGPASADAPPTAGSEQSAPPTAAAPPPTASPAPAANANANAAVPSMPMTQQVASATPPPRPAPPEAPPSAAAPAMRAAAPSASAVATAPLAPIAAAEPAVPAVPATPSTRMAMVNPSDAQLGFRPSSAPPLSAGVSQWVSPPVLAHYRETAAQAGSAGTAEAAVGAVPVASYGKRGGRTGTGASTMPGDVVANLDAIPGTPMGRAASMNGGVSPTEIIYFPGDTTTLSKSALAQVRSAVAAFQSGGGAGTVKVVGHASSRTSNMPVERHLEMIFQKSQARANAVAQALIKAGVPADKVQIEAVGDSQPIYYESMPKGEDGNRRAEIFVQG